MSQERKVKLSRTSSIKGKLQFFLQMRPGTVDAVIFKIVWGSMYQSLGLLLCGAGDDSQCCESFFMLINLCD